MGGKTLLPFMGLGPRAGLGDWPCAAVHTRRRAAGSNRRIILVSLGAKAKNE
jgi:hypothetical protein